MKDANTWFSIGDATLCRSKKGWIDLHVGWCGSPVVQYFLTPLLLSTGFVASLLSNLLYGFALSYYHYTQFLGYNGEWSCVVWSAFELCLMNRVMQHALLLWASVVLPAKACHLQIKKIPSLLDPYDLVKAKRCCKMCKSSTVLAKTVPQFCTILNIVVLGIGVLQRCRS